MGRGEAGGPQFSFEKPDYQRAFRCGNCNRSEGNAAVPLITADMALEQGKEVFAVPGRVNDPLSEGCNGLIKQGAALLQTPEDILDFSE